MHSDENIQLHQQYIFLFEIDDDDDDADDNFLVDTETVQDLIELVKSFSDALQQLRNAFKDSFTGRYMLMNTS